MPEKDPYEKVGEYMKQSEERLAKLVKDATAFEKGKEEKDKGT